MEDKEIIDLYLARSERAITETAAKYGNLIKSIAYSILKNHADSEECENDTYYAAWNRIPPQIPACFHAFLGRIARNIALDRHDYYAAEKRSRDMEVLLSELGEVRSGGESAESALDAKEVSECISAFLHTKERAKRVIFVRRYWYCDPVAKIAADYGFSESKVKSMLMRMRKELKIYLERNGLDV